MKDSVTTRWTVWLGRFCYALLWLPYFFIGIIFGAIVGAIEGAYQWARTWIKWTPEIWKEMH